MASGIISSHSFGEGYKFEFRWEQIQNPNLLYSVIKFDVYFYTPVAGVSIWNPWGNLRFADSRGTGYYSNDYASIAACFKSYPNEEQELRFETSGYHYIYSTYAVHKDRDDAWYNVGEDKAYHILHYSSGSPKSYYDLDISYSTSLFYVNLYSPDLTVRPLSEQISFYGASIVLDPLGDPVDTPTYGSGKPSSITCSDAYLGEYAKITLVANEINVRHTITYEFGSLSGTVVANKPGLSYAWEVPYEFLNEIPTGASHGTCKLTCYTYDTLGNLIGETFTTFVARMDVNKEGPTFAPTIYDNNQLTLSLTGDEKTFIRYYSEAYVWSGALGKAGATIVENSVSCGSYYKSNKTDGSGLYIIEGVDSGTFSFTATDSRGATASTSVKRTLIPYTKITCNVFDLNLTTDGTLTFTIQGNYFNDTFGAVNNSLAVKYKINDGQYATVNSSNIEITGHNFETKVTITGLDYSQIYSVEAVATDRLSSAGEDNVYSVTGRPLFDWGKEDFNFNIQVKAQEGIQIAPDQAVYGDDEGALHEALVPLDSTGNTVLGRGGYLRNNGNTTIYGTNVDVNVHEDFTVNGMSLINKKVLWQGGLMMGANHTVNLPEDGKISQQPNGIVLVFSLYRNGAAEDVSINSFFISKKEVELLPGAPHFFLLGINAGFSSLAGKYIYIHNDKLVGHEGNDDVGSSVISFSNSSYVLRYVIGV